MKEINLKVSGMHCTGCSKRLEKVLNNLDGVESANVDFESTIAHIVYDENVLNIEKIKEAIEYAGFEGEI